MKLVEGIDYVLEDNKMVFTREFLLKRGYCCNSRCRNCPYSKKVVTENDEVESPVQIIKMS